MSPHVKRRRRIIPGSFQMRLLWTFLGMSALSLFAQSLLIQYYVSQFANAMPSGGDHLMDALPGMALKIVVISFAILLPATFLLGVAATFRIAGPVYRFETYLEQVTKGEATGPCRIRKEDHLQRLCELINSALETARREGSASVEGSPDDQADERRAA